MKDKKVNELLSKTKKGQISLFEMVAVFLTIICIYNIYLNYQFYYKTLLFYIKKLPTYDNS